MGFLFNDILSDATSGSRSLDIDRLNIGFSRDGIKKYRENLRDSLIDGTSDVLKNNFETVKNAIDEGWQGHSRDVFMAQLSDTISRIESDLKKEYRDLNNRFEEIENNYFRQDEELMNS